MLSCFFRIAQRIVSPLLTAICYLLNAVSLAPAEDFIRNRLKD